MLESIRFLRPKYRAAVHFGPWRLHRPNWRPGEAQPCNTLLLGMIAALAVLLTAIGIYGVMSYSVNQRVHEIGIRMALGAQRRDVLRLLVGQAARLALIGVAAGLAGAFALMHFISNLLFGVSPGDPGTFAAVVLLVVAVVVLASYIPARRAVRVDPMTALRYE